MRSFNSAFLVVLTVAVAAAEPRAKNVILFLGDAGGLSTLNAASLHGYGEPQKLYLQSMPHIGLSDTSTPRDWVSDSAAGMTAIVTGHKTLNGVVSQSADAVRGKKDGATLKTILEYAEERGLSTGVITNRPVYDATPAACYAHVNSRSSTGEILSQFLKPRFGDGVDILIGTGRKAGLAATTALGSDWTAEVEKKGYKVLDSVASFPTDSRRSVALLESDKYDLAATLDKVLDVLSRNPKGYFLMVEWDMHTDKAKDGLDNVLEADRAIRRTAARVGSKNTLILFTADHSFDLRLRGGRRGKPLFEDPPPADSPAAKTFKPAVRVDGGHTGEEVVVAAQGPGSERVHGFMPNSAVFRVLMSAYGWTEDKETSQPATAAAATGGGR